MKTFIGFFLFALSVNSMASEILCSLKKGDTRYKISVDVSEEQNSVTFYMFGQTGQQGLFPVGRQEFFYNEDVEGDRLIFDLPVKGPGFSQGYYDFTEVVMEAGGEEDLVLKIKGPAIKEGELTFVNCLAGQGK